MYTRSHRSKDGLQENLFWENGKIKERGNRGDGRTGKRARRMLHTNIEEIHLMKKEYKIEENRMCSTMIPGISISC